MVARFRVREFLTQRVVPEGTKTWGKQHETGRAKLLGRTKHAHAPAALRRPLLHKAEDLVAASDEGGDVVGCRGVHIRAVSRALPTAAVNATTLETPKQHTTSPPSMPQH